MKIIPKPQTVMYFVLKRWKCDEFPSLPTGGTGWSLGEPGQSQCLRFETSLDSCLSKGLSAPPKQEAFTSEEN